MKTLVYRKLLLSLYSIHFKSHQLSEPIFITSNMYLNTFSTLFPSLFFLSSIVLASNIPNQVQARKVQDTAEIYYLTNCFQSKTLASYAEIDYYSDSSFSLGGTKPDLRGHVNKDTSVDWEDGTWTVRKPFDFSVYIGVDAYTAAAGTLVGNANSSTFAGPMNCYRLDRRVLFSPKSNWDCYSDYACVDVSSW